MCTQDDGRTALFLAAVSRDLDTLRILLENGAAPSVTDHVRPFCQFHTNLANNRVPGWSHSAMAHANVDVRRGCFSLIQAHFMLRPGEGTSKELNCCWSISRR